MYYVFTDYVNYQTQLFDINVYPVKYNNEWLFGWFHIKITSTAGDTKNMERVVGQAQTTDNQIIPGEFLLTNFAKGGSCETGTKTSTGSSGPIIEKKSYLPCLYAADPSPTVVKNAQLRIYVVSTNYNNYLFVNFVYRNKKRVLRFI